MHRFLINSHVLKAMQKVCCTDCAVKTLKDVSAAMLDLYNLEKNAKDNRPSSAGLPDSQTEKEEKPS